MLQKLYSAAEIAERYGTSECTARRYMRKMRHMESPLRVREEDLREWENRRTVDSPDVVRKRMEAAREARLKVRAREQRRRSADVAV